MGSIQIIRRDGAPASTSRLTPTAKRIVDFIEKHGTADGVFRNQDVREETGMSPSALTDAAALRAMRPYTCRAANKSLGAMPGERLWGLPATIARIVKAHDGEVR